jgi:hypothetical protein
VHFYYKPSSDKWVIYLLHSVFAFGYADTFLVRLWVYYI